MGIGLTLDGYESIWSSRLSQTIDPNEMIKETVSLIKHFTKDSTICVFLTQEDGFLKLVGHVSDLYSPGSIHRLIEDTGEDFIPDLLDSMKDASPLQYYKPHETTTLVQQELKGAHIFLFPFRNGYRNYGAILAFTRNPHRSEIFENRKRFSRIAKTLSERLHYADKIIYRAYHPFV